jgi:hypothetical protein
MHNESSLPVLESTAAAEADETLVGKQFKPYNILVCIPSHETIPALFAYDLCQMMNLTLSVMPSEMGHDLGLAMNIGTYIHKSRTELLEQALASGASHILWLDSDMRFPPDALLRLLRHQKPVVGINYSKRRFPPEFVAIKRVPDPEALDDFGEFLLTNEESTGLAEVDAVGFGMVLMETEGMEALPDPRHEPWFTYKQTKAGQTIGEDVYFCKYMLQERLKHRILVDQDLSWECAHIGSFQYRCSHAALAMEDGLVNYPTPAVAAEEAA